MREYNKINIEVSKLTNLQRLIWSAIKRISKKQKYNVNPDVIKQLKFNQYNLERKRLELYDYDPWKENSLTNVKWLHH